MEITFKIVNNRYTKLTWCKGYVSLILGFFQLRFIYLSQQTHTARTATEKLLFGDIVAHSFPRPAMMTSYPL